MPANITTNTRGIPTARPIPGNDPVGPLSEEHFALLRSTLDARRPVRNAARTAYTSGTTILVIGVAGIPIVLIWPGWLGFIMVIGICTIGILEYKGAQRMRAGAETAAGFLGRNQLAFMALIVAYCVVQMVTFASTPASDLISPELRAQLAQVPGLEQDLTRDLESIAPAVTYGFYALVILLTLAAQGSLAAYYFSRRKHLEALQRETPPWIRRVLTELNA
jgi:hypothetical protein